MSDRGEFLRALVLAVAPAVAPAIVEHVLKSAHRDAKPSNAPKAEAGSFRAYVEARKA